MKKREEEERQSLRKYKALSYAQSHSPVFVLLTFAACLSHLPTNTWIVLRGYYSVFCVNGLLNLSGWASSLYPKLVIYGVVESNTPLFCLSTGVVVRTAAEIVTVRVLHWWCASSSNSRQLVAAKPPGAVHSAEENKSIKARALLLASLVRGGAELWRGRHHVYLIQLGSLWGLPWEKAGKKGAAGLSNKDVQSSPLPLLNPPH